MAQAARIELYSGVYLTAVHTKKFKSSVLGATFLCPLDGETASRNALIPSVLRRGTETHRDMEALEAALDELYGGTIEPVVRTRGEVQCVGFLGSFLDDAYTLDGSTVVEPAAALLGELLLSPYKEEGRFCPDYVKGERENLVERIRAQINDKRIYAMTRLRQEMCAGEPFGVDRLGDEAHASALTAEDLWEGYQELLRTAPMELYYCGSAQPERVAAALKEALSGLPTDGQRREMPQAVRKSAPETPRYVEEAMDVTQGKLTMGFRTGCDLLEEGYPALMVANALFGGTTTSRLFLNVREKLSLCYYASSQLMKYKDLMLVSSGVEFDRFAAARDEILSQLDQCRRGDFTDQELESARRSVVSGLRSIPDSQARLEDYWLGQAVSGCGEDPAHLARRVEGVTREAVVTALGGVALDTIYFLKGKEG